MLPCGLSAYSFGYVTGWMGRGTERANPSPLDAFGLMDLAAEAGLYGVELPVGMVQERAGAVKRGLRERGLRFVLDGGLVLDEHLPDWLRLANALETPTLRVVLSSILCGDRSPMAGQWQDHLNTIAERLAEVEPLAREMGIAIALENHQDATSDDLVWLCRQVESSHIGVNLDAGNPLAVGECPIAYLEKIAPYLKNIHLKDYLMFPTESGYRLVRCPLGEGVMDWVAVFDVLGEKAPDATRNIELGAMSDRHIRLFEPSWWEHYPERDARELLEPMRLLMTRGQPFHAEYRVPWERGLPPAAQQSYELEQFHRSVSYLKSLFQ